MRRQKVVAPEAGAKMFSGEGTERNASSIPDSRLRIGVFIESLPDTGGGFHQAFSTTMALMRGGSMSHALTVFTPHEATRRRLAEHGIEAVKFSHSLYRFLDLAAATALGAALARRLRTLGLTRLGRHLDALLDDHEIDLVLLNEAAECALRLEDHPFVITVWDLDHREHPEFPEVSTNEIGEHRDRILTGALPRAVAVIVNCAYHADRIQRLYNVERERIVELPLVPAWQVLRRGTRTEGPTVEAIRAKYRLPERFVFLPSYFLPQKNHLYLLEGLVELERRHGIRLNAVFCGGPGVPDNEGQVRAQARALGLHERVWFLGIVPDEEMPALYRAAVALVMPTYWGPTNIPPLEAAALGCPVVYSDLPGFRDHMRDAALYCDLDDPSNLADHLARISTDPMCADILRTAGTRLAKEVAEASYGDRLQPVLNRFRRTRACWSWPRE